MIEEIYALWFNNIIGLGNKSKALLLSNIGSYEEIYKAGDGVYNEIVGEKLKDKISNSKDLNIIHKLYDTLKKENIKVTYLGHESYPSKIVNIYDFPFIIYYKGKEMNDYLNKKKSVAVVGSRKATFYGKEIAKSFSKQLAKEKINIISGLAYGIDSAGHIGALEGDGYTIGVLGCGINIVYPQSSSELYDIISKKGTIISEYGLNVAPHPGLFPQRNRIISGLSDGVLVVEAEKKSGSLITADFALEQGKIVMAIPGKITDSKSIGCNNLIKMGAYCINDYYDVLEAVGVEVKNNRYDEKKCDNFEEKENCLAPLEKIVYSCVSLEPVYIDDILFRTNIRVTELINILFSLENKGMIKQPVKGYYIVNI